MITLAVALVWTLCGLGTVWAVAPALTAARRRTRPAPPSVLRALRPVRLADLTDASEPAVWDTLAGADPWRGLLRDARMRDHLHRRKAA